MEIVADEKEHVLEEGDWKSIDIRVTDGDKKKLSTAKL